MIYEDGAGKGCLHQKITALGTDGAVAAHNFDAIFERRVAALEREFATMAAAFVHFCLGILRDGPCGCIRGGGHV